jgi:hypothetical protein
MGYTDRSGFKDSTVDFVALYQREKAKSDLRKRSASVAKPRKKSLHATKPPRSDAAVRDALSWLNTPFRVHQPLQVQRLLGLALERRYPDIKWDPRKSKGKRIQPALPWKNRTRKLRDLARAEENELRRFSSRPTSVLGQSVSEVLAYAARDFRLSTTTLRRLVRGEAKSLSWIFAERLRKRLKATEWNALERALLSPKARSLRNDYANYISSEIDRLMSGRKGHPGMVFTPAEREHIDSFERHLKLLGAPATRASVALYRVYDPLVAWRPTNHWFRNLPEDARAKLVKDGLKRELGLVRTEMRLFREAARLA